MGKPSYEQTLEFLFSQLPMYQRQGKSAFKKDLKNIVALAEALGNPHRKFPVIHVAGTNGKGSVSHIIASVLQAAGMKVGLYTSPHYADFRERIKINGEFMDENSVIEFVEAQRPIIDEIQPSFFEITVAMAFDYFAKQQVHIAIIETGLGGRLDSTNIVQPILSVITNISFDHMEMLGDTLPLIAAEKAGIMKSMANTVVGRRNEETDQVFEKRSAELNNLLIFSEDYFAMEEVVLSDKNWVLNVLREDEIWLENIVTDIQGPFQLENLRTAVSAIGLLMSILEIDEKHIREGLKDIQGSTNFMGRWMRLGSSPTVIADSAHNADGLRSVFDRLKALPADQQHFVLGVVKEKDLAAFIEFLPKNGFYYCSRPSVPRGLPTEDLQQAFKAAGLKCRAFPTIQDAYLSAKLAAKNNDLIYVGGSTFVVADLLQYLKEKEMSKKGEEFMREAIRLSIENVKSGNGGPFAAVVVKDGEIVATGCNSVTSANDPTAHAEVMAIRNACTALGSFQLDDCEIYTSCEPCPMCLGAIYWARPKAVYFGNTKQDAADIEFDDQFIYDEIDLPMGKRKLPLQPLLREEALEAFRLWATKNDKIEY